MNERFVPWYVPLRGDCLNVEGEGLIFPVNIRVSEGWAFSRVPSETLFFLF